MANAHNLSRRKAFLVAGAAGLGVLGLTPAPALASRWPRLDKALVEMREAKKVLQDAPTVFGGHKKEAIEALDRAIKEIEAAIQFAEKK